jgi:type I restriction enzyme S subunit
MPLPPIELQSQFATIVKKVEGIKSRYQASLADLETLYGALSQKAFKGELDLSRVSLPSDSTEATAEENTAINELKPTTDTFDLPAPPDLTTLNSAEGRNALLNQWLTVWLEHLNGTPFSTQSFIEAAQQRLWDLAEDDALELGAVDYNQIKSWTSKAVVQGRLAQTYDNANNRVQLKAVSHR